MDIGVLDADRIVRSQERYRVDRLGPMRLDGPWQAHAGVGCDAQHFPIDGDRQHAICPGGKPRISWTPAVDHRGEAVITVKCSTKDCRLCPM